MMPCWMSRVWFPIRHPREALCDAGVWKCPTHPRMLWLASERRWAWRHKLRARRVARWTGWQPGELDALLAVTAPAPAPDARAALLARLAGDMRLSYAKRHRAATWSLLDDMRAAGYVLAPWQEELIRRHLDGDAVMVGLRP